MSDIVERLNSGDDTCLREAADEIERLRAALKDIAGMGPPLDIWAARGWARAALEEKK